MQDSEKANALLQVIYDEITLIQTADMYRMKKDTGNQAKAVNSMLDNKLKFREAANALAQLKDTRALELLNKILIDDYTPINRSSAAAALGAFKNPLAIDPLIKALDDAVETVRISSVKALSNYDDPRIVPALIEMLYDTDEEVCKTAAKALDNPNDDRIGYQHHQEIEIILNRRTTTPVGSLKINLDSLDINVRLKAILDLSGNVDEEATTALIGLLHEQDKRILEPVLCALWRRGDAKATEQLISMADHEDADIRYRVIRALGKAGDERAVDTLIASLKDKATVRTAMFGLRRFNTPKKIPPLTETLADILADIDADSYYGTNEVYHQSSSDLVKAACMQALKKLMDRRGDTNKEVKEARTLRRIKILHFLMTWELRKSEDILKVARKDKDRRVAKMAREGLSEIKNRK